jgi:hypothetical protein
MIYVKLCPKCNQEANTTYLSGTGPGDGFARCINLSCDLAYKWFGIDKWQALDREEDEDG